MKRIVNKQRGRDASLRVSMSPWCIPLAAALFAGEVRAQTSYPMITGVYPTGCRRGTTSEIAVNGSGNLGGAYAVFVEGTGVTAEVVVPNPPPDPAKPQNSIMLKVTAAADAPLGPREFRVMTPRGSSTIGMLVVGAEPEALEKEGNNTLADATPVQLPATLNGRIQQGEDVDNFRFAAKAGQEVVFNCISARLQDKMHDLSPGGGGAHSDPLLVLTDPAGREIATADDYWGPDPLLVHKFEQAGDYVLQIRHVRYQGHAGWSYRVTATAGPFLTAVYPMAGQRGQAVAVQPVGYNLGGM